MIHKTLAAALLLLVTRPAEAQLVASVDEDRTRVYRMTVSPATEPSPRLRHRLVAADGDLRPGNAATFWYRAMLDLDAAVDRNAEELGAELREAGLAEDADADVTDRRIGRDAVDRWRNPLKTSLGELPLDRAKQYLEEVGGWRRSQMAEAALRERCDWNLGLREFRGPEAVEFLLPEFQGSRDLARLVALEARVAIAAQRHDDALDCLRVLNALAVDAAEPPLLVCRLVGGAIGEVARAAQRELMCQPDAPSLYWAMVDRPRPLISGRGAIRFEATFAPRMYALLNKPESGARSPAEWQRQFSECLDSLADLATHDERSAELIAWIDGLRDADSDHPGVRLARERLLDQGYEAAELDAMPTAQLLSIDALGRFREASDLVEATFQLPWPEGREARAAATARIAEIANLFGDSPDREVLPIATLTVADMYAAETALLCQEREFAALRLVAALRLHAGETGSLPDSLEAIDVAPAPRNPATGEPFAYRLEGGAAIIDLPASDGPAWAERYEVRLRP